MTDAESRGAEAWLLDTGDRNVPTASGKTVNVDESLSLSAVYAAARAIAEDLSCMPLKVFRQLDSGGKVVAKNDPKWFSEYLGREVNLYSLAHGVAAPDMINMTLRSLLVWWAQLYGNGFAQIMRDNAGNPTGLCPLHPHSVEVKVDPEQGTYYIVGNKYRAADQAVIWPENMIRIIGPSNDGIVGNLTTEYAAEAFGIYLAAEEHSATFFGQGATLSGIVSFDQQFKDKEARRAYREDFNRVYGGSANAGKWMVADNGAKVSTLSVDPEKSQLVETLKFRIEDVARWFRVPPVIIGHNTGTPYANIEPLGRFYYNFGLKPWALRIEQEYDLKLSDGDAFFEHVVDSLMWADPKTRTEVHAMRIRSGIASPNEARAIENMNPYEGGDRYRVEQNLALLDESGVPQQANNNAADQPVGTAAAQSVDTEAIKLALMPVMSDAATRLIAREVNAITGKKAVTDKWLDSFYAGHRTAVVESLEGPMQTACMLLGRKHDRSKLEQFADAHVAESRRRIEEGDAITAWKIDRPAWIAQRLTDEVCND